MGWDKRAKDKCKLVNFLFGEAKLAIYLTRRDRLQTGAAQNVVALWKCNVKARLRLEFCFHKATKKVDTFTQTWGFENALCQVSDHDELILADYLG